jgi:acetyltransferase-like isoleucine patch superfamily enzyme
MRLRDLLGRSRRAARSAEAEAAALAARFGAFGPGASVGPRAELSGDLSRVFLGARSRVEDGARIICAPGGSIVLGEDTIIHPGAILDTGPGGRIQLGAKNSVNPYCVVYGHGGLTTGSFVRIAAQTVIIPANHIYDDPERPIARQGLRKEGIVIGDDVWVGSGCRILDGVTIGNGAVLAAGAVVHRDVEPYTVVGGVPARLLKRRPAPASA